MSTTLEANAALRTIVRRDTGEGYEEFLTKLAKASGIGMPTRADLVRIDRKRKKKGSNEEWRHPHDPDAKITKNAFNLGLWMRKLCGIGTPRALQGRVRALQSSFGLLGALIYKSPQSGIASDARCQFGPVVITVAARA